MEEKFICALAEFDTNTQDKMSRLYGTLAKVGIIGRQTKDIPYHLTLGYFDVSLEEELKLISKSISEETLRFELNFSHLGIFDLNVLFCAPDVNYELLDIKHKICDGRTEEIRGWTAHSTLLIDDDKIIDGLKIIGKSFSRIEGERI